MITTHAAELGTVDRSEMLSGVLSVLSYTGVAVAVLVVGFLVLDLLIPGNLRDQIFIRHKPNAAIIAAAMHLALAMIVATSVVASSSSSLAQGLVDTLVFGLLGVLLFACALVILELVIPGRFRDIVESPTPLAGAWAAAATLLSLGVVIAAAVS